MKGKCRIDEILHFFMISFIFVTKIFAYLVKMYYLCKEFWKGQNGRD